MSRNRVFFPQEALDGWIEEGRVALEGDELTANPEARVFRLHGAVRILGEVTTGEDPNALVGKVKTLEQLAELGGEHAPGSLILGDNAYEITDGFAGELLPRESDDDASADAPDDSLGRLLGHGRA